MKLKNIHLYALGILAMIAFAGNSILNRLALVDGEAGAWSFTLIRLISGAVMLALLSRFRLREGSWAGAVSLLVYAAGFSFAYLALGAGVGALILFAVVQFTMMGRGVAMGERFSAVQWLGSLMAFGSMVWLLWPTAKIGGQSTSIWAIAPMIAAGIGWGVYSLIGRDAKSPLLATTGNFLRASIIALALSLPIFYWLPEALPSQTAIIAAIASGAITSGLGYAIWYAALPGFSRSQAGIMQLSVPALAAIGGVLFIGEVLTGQLIISTVVVLAGIGLTVLGGRSD